MGRIKAVCISEKKGTVKTDVKEALLIEDYGLSQDAHAGSERQVSLLSYESVEAFKKKMAQGGAERIVPGVFGENLLVEGYDLKSYPVGTRFRCGEVCLELTQIGKTCHTGCEIARLAGDCIMPREGVFARVLRGGMVRVDDRIDRILTASVITVSDRSFRGLREDRSGPVLCEALEAYGYRVLSNIVLPDEEEQVYETLVRTTDEAAPDMILTTGGTGFSERDRTPEATLRAGERNAPGIAEALRAESLKITPHAMLSRGASVIRGRTLIVNLPGSPKAVKECLSFLLPPIEHGLLILRGEADG